MRILATVLGGLAAGGAMAAGPFVVEDAALVDPQACQLETWTRRPSAGYENYFLPACNPWGNLEIQVGGARLRSSDADADATILQFKTVLHEAADRSWALGLVAGIVGVRVRDGGGHDTDGYVTLAATLPVVADKFAVNLNAGLLRVGAQNKVTGTWGVSADLTVNEWVRFTGEAYRLAQPRPSFQAGGFVSIVPSRVEIVALYGNTWGGGGTGRWFSVGLQLYSPPFLR
jgi:hypothetical protein